MRKRRQAKRKCSETLEKALPQQLSGSMVHGDRRHQPRLLPPTQQILTKCPLPGSQRPPRVTRCPQRWEWGGGCSSLPTAGTPGRTALLNKPHRPASVLRTSTCSRLRPVLLPSLAGRSRDPPAGADEALAELLLETCVHPPAGASRKPGPPCPCLSQSRLESPVLGIGPLPGSFRGQSIDQPIGRWGSRTAQTSCKTSGNSAQRAYPPKAQ